MSRCHASCSPTLRRAPAFEADPGIQVVSVHAGYGKADIENADGLNTFEFTRLPYRKVRRPVWPLDAAPA